MFKYLLIGVCGVILFTKISVYNPYKISLNIEIKCKPIIKNKYSYYNKFKIKKRNNLLIEVPKSVTNCEIWPSNVEVF